MNHLQSILKPEPEKLPSDRSVGLLFSGLIVLLGLWNKDVTFAFYGCIGLSALFLVLSLFRPKALRLINVYWYSLGMLLGLIVTPIIMLLLYLVVVWPTGLLYFLFRKDPLNRNLSPDISSYWIVKKQSEEIQSTMRDMF